MYEILLRLILIGALAEFGADLLKTGDCATRSCVSHVRRVALKAAKIDWRPISVFPDQAKRFQ